MACVHPQPGQSNQLHKTNYYTEYVNKFHEPQINPTESRQLLMEESLVHPLRSHVSSLLTLRCG